MALLFPLTPLAFNFGELVAAFTVGVVSGRWGVSMVVEFLINLIANKKTLSINRSKVNFSMDLKHSKIFF